MQGLFSLVEATVSFAEDATSKEEHWGALKLSGSYRSDIYHQLLNLLQKYEEESYGALIRVELDGNLKDAEELSDAKDIGFKFGKWLVSINKEGLVRLNKDTGLAANFFISLKSCENWLAISDPFDPDMPINACKELKIIVFGLKKAFGNPSLEFLPAEINNPIIYPTISGLPNFDKIQEHVHLISAKKIVVAPDKFILTGGDFSSDIANKMMSLSIKTLGMTLVHEYHDNEKIILEGVKRVSLKFGLAPENPATQFYDLLIKVVQWLYEDKISVRKKLFSERLGLDVNPELGFLENLSIHISSPFDQAKQRYNFVIIERKDAYLKELRDLLKDIKTQSELYSIKIRTLLSNFLRDLLAAIVLIGFTIFTKFSDSLTLDNSKLLDFVFYTLGVYYIFSIVMQSIVDSSDIRVSKRELLYWKSAINDYIPERDFLSHIKKSLKGRRNSLHWIYPIIAICYILIAIACFYYPTILRDISAK